MNVQLTSILLTIALALVSAYIAWVHHRQSKTEERVSALEVQLAAFSSVQNTLRDLDRKLDRVARVVYLIAGKDGVVIHDP